MSLIDTYITPTAKAAIICAARLRAYIFNARAIDGRVTLLHVQWRHFAFATAACDTGAMSAQAPPINSIIITRCKPIEEIKMFLGFCRHILLMTTWQISLNAR